MPKLSAGLLLYRYVDHDLRVLLVHPGGPYWRGKNEGAWSIPKGEYNDSEDALAAARREFEEETGQPAPADPASYLALTSVRQPSGKLVSAWAVQADFDPSSLRSNAFTMEWPRGSGKTREFPEVDRARWCPVAEALTLVQKGQVPLIWELARILAA